MIKFNEKTKVCCLIGDPVEHSLSPIMYNTAFSELGLNFVYFAFGVKKEILKDAVNAIKIFQIRGANVTIPHKVEIMKFLDEVDETALKIGAVNTIVNDDGKLKGFNTDALGFSRTIKKNKVVLKNANVVLFGAGGAARAVAFQCVLEGATELTIVNRTIRNAEKIKEQIMKEFGKKIEIISLLEGKKIKEKVKNADILINATSVGMFPEVNESVVSKKLLHSNLVVMDIVYNPIETKLLMDARKIYCKKTINGIEMLLQQGALAFELWIGKKAPIDLMRKVVTNELKK